MSLDALAPDQRAVVQLVLQQDRSYEDLAGLLGITPAAVRERAHRGLERLAPGAALAASERETIGDYLLGQQSVSERESTRALLSGSQPARSWAHAVSTELASVARSPLPEIPAGTDAPAESLTSSAQPEETEPVMAGDDDPLLSDPVAPTTRARPRPRQRAQDSAPADFGFGEVADDAKEKDKARDSGTDADDRQAPSTSRLGGALLIAGLAILVAALVIFLVNRGNDEDPEPSASSTPTAESTAAASGSPDPADFQAQGFLELRPVEGKGRGILVLFATPDGDVAINVEAERLEPAGQNEAYGLWLTGGTENHFLGYATVNEDGTLQTSGPQEEDTADFAERLLDAKKVVLSLENADPGPEPARVILEGRTDSLRPIASPTATP